MTIAKDTENGLTMANDTPMESSENQPTTNNNNTATTTATNESSTHEGMESQQQHPQLGGETTAEQKGDDDDTVTRLLLDMEIFKRRKGERLVDETKTKDHASKADDASSVSNVSEGLSLDHSVGQDSPDHDGSVLSDEAPSTGWKDAKIAKLQSDLDKAKSEIWEWEQKEKTAQAQIQITEQKLVVAHREAEEAKKKQNAREGNLRDAVAQQKRLETECQQIQQKVASLEEQLEQAKRDARLHEEETKAARKRAAEYHAQFKKLQEKHENAMKLIEEQVRKIGTLEVGAK
jgi:DNA repair exonuclease SbcCD ATPase subunit